MSAQPCMSVVSMTVSLEFKNSTYGQPTAENHFINLQAKVPEGSPGITTEDALMQSLELHLTAYESLLSAELMGDHINAETFNNRMTRIRKRFAKIQTYLKEESTNG